MGVTTLGGGLGKMALMGNVGKSRKRERPILECHFIDNEVHKMETRTLGR